jgi:CheY-like chemotaxis protein/anti-sigma regulatory factor (Ser/Thr protein kinase)
MEQAEAKGLGLVFEQGTVANDFVSGDLNRIQQVVVNAILNAIKFTNTGSIVVAVNKIGEDDEYAEFRVSVTDTGIGIEDADLERVFELFYQVDGSSTREYGGTGLGLTICKQLVEQMNGDIGITSAIGEGSEFWFTLRLKIAASADEFDDNVEPTHQAESVDNFDCRVLLVEDNPVNQDVAQLMLKKLGCETKIANDGVEAVEYFTQAHWDIVFMDCQMPRMDGYDATSRIRQWEQEHNVDATPIVALTANALEGDAERCFAAGMTDFISKPYKISQLSDAMRRIGTSSELENKTDDWTRSFYDKAEPLTLCMDPIEELQELQATGETDIVAEVIATFVSSAQASIDEIGAAAETQDADTIRAAAHRLKGASASVGGQRLASLCAALEQACSVKDKSSLIADVRNTNAEFRKLVEKLRELKTCSI